MYGVVILSMESLLKSKNQYTRTPCTNYFRSGVFIVKLYLFYKRAYLNEEVICTDPILAMRHIYKTSQFCL
jgi:hypothetical protein